MREHHELSVSTDGHRDARACHLRQHRAIDDAHRCSLSTSRSVLGRCVHLPSKPASTSASLRRSSGLAPRRCHSSRTAQGGWVGEMKTSASLVSLALSGSHPRPRSRDPRSGPPRTPIWDPENRPKNGGPGGPKNRPKMGVPGDPKIGQKWGSPGPPKSGVRPGAPARGARAGGRPGAPGPGFSPPGAPGEKWPFLAIFGPDRKMAIFGHFPYIIPFSRGPGSENGPFFGIWGRGADFGRPAPGPEKVHISLGI